MKTIIKKNYAIINKKDIQSSIYLRTNTTDIHVYHQIFMRGDYETSFPFYPKTIIDCGANIGLATVYFKNKYPNAKIISIEPEESNFNMLIKNCQGYHDIYCLKSGIWNENTYLNVVDNGYGHWGFATEKTSHENNKVSGVTIDYIMNKFNIDEVDILKIDIEGSEKELFEKNIENWIEKVKVIIIELHDRNGLKEIFLA